MSFQTRVPFFLLWNIKDILRIVSFLCVCVFLNPYNESQWVPKLLGHQHSSISTALFEYTNNTGLEWQ